MSSRPSRQNCDALRKRAAELLMKDFPADTPHGSPAIIRGRSTTAEILRFFTRHANGKTVAHPTRRRGRNQVDHPSLLGVPRSFLTGPSHKDPHTNPELFEEFQFTELLKAVKPRHERDDDIWKGSSEEMALEIAENRYRRLHRRRSELSYWLVNQKATARARRDFTSEAQRNICESLKSLSKKDLQQLIRTLSSK